MTAVSFDSNILIDALHDRGGARREIAQAEDRWISRLTWIEVMSKVDASVRQRTELLLSAFDVDEVTLPISAQAARLRNDSAGLKLPDAVILASAQINGRILVTRNTKDFPAEMPGVRIPYTL